MVYNNNFIYTYSVRINLFLPNEMIIKKYNSILIIIFLLLSLSLISAYVIEYGLGHKPCKLCLYQRYPYYISILLLTSIFLLKKNIKIHYLILSVVSLLGSIIAFYHFGIEQGFFNESFVCETKSFNTELSKEDILKQLKKNTISCKEVTFSIFGVSVFSTFSFSAKISSLVGSGGEKNNAYSTMTQDDKAIAAMVFFWSTVKLHPFFQLGHDHHDQTKDYILLFLKLI